MDSGTYDDGRDPSGNHDDYDDHGDHGDHGDQENLDDHSNDTGFDHAGPSGTHPTGVGANGGAGVGTGTDATGTAAANAVAPGGSIPTTDDGSFPPPPPLPAEQQEQAQAVVNALAHRIHHAASTAGLMELTADALAEVADAFGAEIDVERLRTAIIRHCPENGHPVVNRSVSTEQE